MKSARLALIAAALGAGPAAAQTAAERNQLAAEVAQATTQLSRQLPRRVDDVTTLVGIRADGAAFVYDMRINRSINGQADAMRQLIQQQNQTTLCADQAVVTFIRRGGSMRHIYTDPSGAHFETRISRCP